jgi:hypothetical protein
MLSFKLFRLVFRLSWFNRNIETLCFGLEAKQPKQTVRNKPKQTDKTETTVNFMKNISKYALYHTVSVVLRNTKTLCFGIEPKQPKQMFCFG